MRLSLPTTNPVSMFRTDPFSTPFSTSDPFSFLSGLCQDDLVAFLQGHDGFFPIRRAAGGGGALAARFAVDVQRVDLGDFDLEQLLHGLANLCLVRPRVGPHSVLIELFALARALLGEPDRLNDFKSVHGSVTG